jgi:hypothetical protein
LGIFCPSSPQPRRLKSDDIKFAFLSPPDAKAAFVSGAIDACSDRRGDDRRPVATVDVYVKEGVLPTHYIAAAGFGASFNV